MEEDFLKMIASAFMVKKELQSEIELVNCLLGNLELYKEFWDRTAGE